MTPRATIDFESKSECPIGSSGSWKYSLHPSTEVLCLAYRLPSWPAGRTGLWHPAMPHLGLAEAELGGPTAFDDLFDLFAWMADGGLLEAHNVPL